MSHQRERIKGLSRPREIERERREDEAAVSETLGAGGVAAAGTAAFVCYRSLWAFFLLMAPLTVVAPRLWQDMLQNKRQRELEKQFREMIQMMSTALSAGYSVDNAIRVCRRDLGRVLMTGCLLVYLASVWLAQKILDIEVGSG